MNFLTRYFVRVYESRIEYAIGLFLDLFKNKSDDVELEFMLEYRRVAIRWAGYAAIAGGIAFYCFFVSALFGDPHNQNMQIVRFFSALY